MPSLCYVVENVGYNKNLVMNANDEPKTAGDLGGKPQQRLQGATGWNGQKHFWIRVSRVCVIGRVQRSSDRRNAGAKQASKPRHSFLPPPPLGELPGGLCLILLFHSTNNSHRRCHLCLTVHAPASENCLPEI
ncbi:hypothetical protein LSTR_LSTR007842 [Laodelphax striatellus]|uniref:Uncharacterized protein n=1 Tax=Laodelphax striatellus TaxID=195883 RepID=A0A482WP39_LAOST|nr:hypothetical protein LSTR_LSTR007842 [Laodelphax striatellus]